MTLNLNKPTACVDSILPDSVIMLFIWDLTRWEPMFDLTPGAGTVEWIQAKKATATVMSASWTGIPYECKCRCGMHFFDTDTLGNGEWTSCYIYHPSRMPGLSPWPQRSMRTSQHAMEWVHVWCDFIVQGCSSVICKIVTTSCCRQRHNEVDSNRLVGFSL